MKEIAKIPIDDIEQRYRQLEAARAVHARNVKYVRGMFNGNPCLIEWDDVSVDSTVPVFNTPDPAKFIKFSLK